MDNNKKTKKERSPAQIAAFNKMIAIRKDNIEKKKIQKEKDKELKKLNRKKKALCPPFVTAIFSGWTSHPNVRCSSSASERINRGLP